MNVAADLGISCDDSQDCPNDMWCREVRGKKRCRRVVQRVDPLIWAYIGSGIVAFIIVAIIILKVKYKVSIKDQLLFMMKIF